MRFQDYESRENGKMREEVRPLSLPKETAFTFYPYTFTQPADSCCQPTSPRAA
jgi:hypothetical protein